MPGVSNNDTWKFNKPRGLRYIPGYNDQSVKKDIINVLDPCEGDTKKGYPFVQLPLSPNPSIASLQPVPQFEVPVGFSRIGFESHEFYKGAPYRLILLKNIIFLQLRVGGTAIIHSA